MSWWSELLRRLRGVPPDDESLHTPPAPSTSDEPPVFECQTCFKIFDSDQRRPVCPECDSSDVKTLTS